MLKIMICSVVHIQYVTYCQYWEHTYVTTIKCGRIELCFGFVITFHFSLGRGQAYETYLNYTNEIITFSILDF